MENNEAVRLFRRFDWWTPLLVVVLGAVWIWMLRRPVGDLVCDGQVMGPGDACISFGGRSFNYEDEMVRQAALHENAQAIVPFAVGLVVLLALLVLWRRIEPRLAPITEGADPAQTTWHERESSGGVLGAIFGVGGTALIVHLLNQGYVDAWPPGTDNTGLATALGVSALIGLFTALAYLVLLGRRSLARLGPDGVQVAVGRRVRQASWTDLDVYETPKRHLRFAGPSGDMKISVKFSEAPVAWAQALKFVLATRLPEVAQRMDAGETVEFGPLRANSASVGDARSQVAWNEVQNFEINKSEDFTIVSTAGNKITVPAKSIANRWVLERLAEVILRTMRGQ